MPPPPSFCTHFSLRAEVQVLPGQCWGWPVENVVDTQEDLLPDSWAQLVWKLHHFHDPPQQWCTGELLLTLSCPLLVGYKIQLSTQEQRMILPTLCLLTTRLWKTSTSRREKPSKLFWSLQTKSSPTSSSWRCYWNGWHTGMPSILPMHGAGWTFL